MDDDDALLNEELHSSGRHGQRGRPPGANAITAIGIVVTLVLWAITAVLLSSFLAGSPGSGVIEPRSIAALIVFGIEAFVAVGIAGRVWVAIGPDARGLLRPIGVLGPWPMIGIAILLTLAVVSPFVAPFLEPPAVTTGRNWYFARDAHQDATYENALQQCGQRGGRVPSRDDLDLFDPPFPRGTRVWIEKSAAQDPPLALEPDGQFVHLPGRTPYANVVCFRP